MLLTRRCNLEGETIRKFSFCQPLFEGNFTITPERVTNSVISNCRDHSGFAYSEILHAFFSSADFFQNQLFLKNSFRNTMGVSNSLDPDQARHLVGPDLGPNCFQRSSADNTSK